MRCEHCKTEIPINEQIYVRIGGELLPYEICRNCQKEINQRMDEYPKVKAAGNNQ